MARRRAVLLICALLLVGQAWAQEEGDTGAEAPQEVPDFTKMRVKQLQVRRNPKISELGPNSREDEERHFLKLPEGSGRSQLWVADGAESDTPHLLCRLCSMNAG